MLSWLKEVIQTRHVHVLFIKYFYEPVPLDIYSWLIDKSQDRGIYKEVNLGYQGNANILITEQNSPESWFGFGERISLLSILLRLPITKCCLRAKLHSTPFKIANMLLNVFISVV